MDEMGVGPAVPEGLGLAGVGEGVGEGQALHDGDADPEAVGRRQHDQKLVEEVLEREESRADSGFPIFVVLLMSRIV